MALGFAIADAGVIFGAFKALDRVNLSVEPGEHLALIGPSGAGKTTLLRLLNGSVVPVDGKVMVDGRDLARMDATALRALRARVAVVHQDLRLVPNLRVSQNVLSGSLGRQGFWAAVRSLVRPSRRELEAAHAILDRVGLGESLFQRVDRLSGGQQQRVAIARALHQRPHMLLADEPVASVDPARARDVVALLVRLAREDGITLVMSLHNLDLAREFFPRVVGLRQGRVVVDDHPASVSARELQALYRLPDEGDHHGHT